MVLVDSWRRASRCMPTDTLTSRVEETDCGALPSAHSSSQRAFAKAYDGHPHFVVPHVVASAPKVVVAEWIEGVHLSHIIKHGTQDQDEHK